MYYKACTKQSPSTTLYYNLAQNTSQYYFVLQSLHKALPSTTLYYKACTNHFPVLLCTTKLAQNNSQYYFVLQKFHRTTPSTTLYYKACTKHSPVLLCTTKVAQRTSSTTLYYKACTKHSAVLLCTSVSLTTNLYKWLHTGEWVWEGSQSTYMGWFFVLNPPKLYGNAWKHSTMGLHCALIPLCENFCCCRLIFWHVVHVFSHIARKDLRNVSVSNGCPNSRHDAKNDNKPVSQQCERKFVTRLTYHILAVAIRVQQLRLHYHHLHHWR